MFRPLVLHRRLLRSSFATDGDAFIKGAKEKRLDTKEARSRKRARGFEAWLANRALSGCCSLLVDFFKDCACRLNHSFSLCITFFSSQSIFSLCRTSAARNFAPA